MNLKPSTLKGVLEVLGCGFLNVPTQNVPTEPHTLRDLAGSRRRGLGLRFRVLGVLGSWVWESLGVGWDHCAGLGPM